MSKSQILDLNGNPTRYEDFIEKVMLKNGYFAPLKLLYKEKWNYIDPQTVKGKTPDYTIQERLQRLDKFTKIGLGVYALTEYLDELEQFKKESENKTSPKEREHAMIQGMLIEIGNNRKDVSNTYTNDKKWSFGGKTLENLTTIRSVPPFTYSNLIQNSVRFVDVIWFNSRGFPSHVYEVEHSTDFRSALVKFMELQDFQTKFVCVSGEGRIKKFNCEIEKVAFKAIKDRVIFQSYQEIKKEYEHSLYQSVL